MSQELITIESDAKPRRSFIRSGIAGNYETVYQMIRLTRDATRQDLGLERFIKQLLLKNNFDSYSPTEEILSLVYDYVKKTVKYIQDISGNIDSIKSARRTLSDGYGDCDDLAILVATLCGYLGFEDVRFVLAKYSASDTSFVHIYVAVYDKDKRYVLDTTLPNGQLNMEVRASEKQEINIFNDVQGLDGVSGLFNNTRFVARKLAKVTIEAIPVMTNFLPIGFFSGTALTTGANLLNQSGGRTLSLNETASRINETLDKLIQQLLTSAIAIDLAKNYATQTISQLSTLSLNTEDRENFPTIQKSIRDKFDFISGFESYAKANNITVVELNPNMMLLAGITGLGLGGYAVWKMFKD